MPDTVTTVPEPINLLLPTLPPRSRLYCLEPVGLDTSEVESLSSYIVRLAEEHSVKVSSLFRWELLPNTGTLGGSEPGIGSTPSAIYRFYRALTGLSSVVDSFTRVLEGLTLITGLKKLTCALWGTAVPTFHLVRRSAAWCPACYHDWLVAGKVIYLPLSWTIEAFTICLKHQRRLSVMCPYCGQRPYYLSADAHSGCCSACNKWLGGECPAEETRRGVADQKELGYEIWAARSIEEWIQNAQRTSVPPTGEIILQTISLCIEQLTGGSINAFARLIEIESQTICSWRAGKHVPSFAHMLKMCFKLGGSLSSFIQGESFLDCIIRNRGSDGRVQSGLVRCPQAPSKIAKLLEGALTEDPPPSLHDLVARSGYKSERALRLASPELCRKITARHRTLVKGKRRSSSPEEYELAGLALERALAEDYPPPIMEIALSLNYKSVTFLRNNYRDLCKAITAKRTEYQRKQLVRRKKKMKAAAKEYPPPGINQLVRRLGLKWPKQLRIACPELYRILVERRAQWDKELKSRAGVILHSALQESPPRSLKSMAEHHGYSIAALKKSYPELCQSILDRYAKYQRENNKKRRASFKEEVRRAVAELYSQGIHPTVQKVKQLLKNPSIGNTIYLLEEVREAKSELGI